ncbi:MAG: hypothetical protein MUD01_12090 [Chloroflexaceae bacterium]|nr:hypothetical protein [Chloroflexaceae bacterium]
MAMLRLVWQELGLDPSLFRMMPWLATTVDWVRSGGDGTDVGLTSLTSPLLLLALALFATILLRNAFPTVRTSAKGMLVEFAGDWLPIPWDQFRAIKVTEDGSGKRYVVLVQTERRALTDWHRFYSLLYSLGWRRSFLITSSISEFDQLVRTLLNETTRLAEVNQDPKIKPRFDETAQSPLFRLLISPLNFFSQGPRPAVAAAGAGAVGSSPTISMPTAVPQGGDAVWTSNSPIQGTYPGAIRSLVTGASLVVLVAMVVQYLNGWVKFLALTFPPLRGTAPFSWVFSNSEYQQLADAYRTVGVPFLGVPDFPNLPAPWWILVSTHLLLLCLFGLLMVVRYTLPALEWRSEGLVLKPALGNAQHLINWNQLGPLKTTQLSDSNQVLLVQTRQGGLPFPFLLNSLLYGAGLKPAIFVTSAISNFSLLARQMLIEATRRQATAPEAEVENSRSWPLWMASRPVAAIEELVLSVRNQPDSERVQTQQLFRPAKAMFWLALVPALLLLLSGIVLSDSPPTARLVVGAVALFVIAFLEWPLVALFSVWLDDVTGGGEEGYRALAIYPLTQLPRVLPLLGALVLLLLGVPVLWVVVWLGAVIWSFVLAGALWEGLYSWTGSQALLGGLLPVIWQLLVMLVFLVAQR